ncbi:hypothetical protein FRC02_001497 [Tulasnella sp. 418]|nr:hypothetical protein FRC02_001497 [Tulasnella sp. 418]
MKLDDLPVEILADIFSLLAISSLIAISQVARRFRAICSDEVLNPWRAPIMEALNDNTLDELATLALRSVVPRHNFIEILSLASPEFLLLRAGLSHLHSNIWNEAFSRRFLPSWRRNRAGQSSQEEFKRCLWNIWHRLSTNCSTQQAWCKYIVLHRSGLINASSAYSRNYDPLVLFETLKAQSDLSHLPTEIRLVVQFRDVRILALGALHRSTSFLVNRFAKMFLHPPGAESTEMEVDVEVDEHQEMEESPGDHVTELHPVTSRESAGSITTERRRSSLFRIRSRSSSSPRRTTELHRTLSLDDRGESSRGVISSGFGLIRWLTHGERSGQQGSSASPSSPESPTSPLSPQTAATSPSSHSMKGPQGLPSVKEVRRTSTSSPYRILRHPLPILQFAKYPNFTPGDCDQRWRGSGELEEDGLVWAGPMLLTAQLTHNLPPNTPFDAASALSEGRFAPFTFEDLLAIAPWMKDKFGKKVDGLGLGI